MVTNESFFQIFVQKLLIKPFKVPNHLLKHAFVQLVQTQSTPSFMLDFRMTVQVG